MVEKVIVSDDKLIAQIHRDDAKIKNLFANVCYSSNIAVGLEELGPRIGDSTTIQAVSFRC